MLHRFREDHYLRHPNDTIECFARAMRLSPLDSFSCSGYTGIAFAHIRTRSLEEAASWATRATHEQSTWAATWRIAAIAYGLSGRVTEAQAAIARMREIDPDLRISTYPPITSPSRRSEDRMALQRAGLPA
jgi:predicted Zn-dependent protease